MQNIQKQFYGGGVSSIDITGSIQIGCPYGGLAVRWRKSLNIVVKANKFEDESSLVGNDLNCSTNCYHVLNVQMTFDGNDNIDEVAYYLCQIDTLFKNNHTVFDMAVGDFNLYGVVISVWEKQKSFVKKTITS